MNDEHDLVWRQRKATLRGMLWIEYLKSRSGQLCGIRFLRVKQVGEPRIIGEWSWTTAGMPAPVLEDVRACLDACMTQDVLFVFGIQDTLDLTP